MIKIESLKELIGKKIIDIDDAKYVYIYDKSQLEGWGNTLTLKCGDKIDYQLHPDFIFSDNEEEKSYFISNDEYANDAAQALIITTEDNMKYFYISHSRCCNLEIINLKKDLNKSE